MKRIFLFFPAFFLLTQISFAQIPVSPMDEMRDSDPFIEDNIEIMHTTSEQKINEKMLFGALLILLLGIGTGILISRKEK